MASTETLPKKHLLHIQTHKLNTTQIRFVDYIINYLTQNGVMDVSTFYDKPFIDLNDLGIDGIFAENEIQRVWDIIKGFDDTLAVG